MVLLFFVDVVPPYTNGVEIWGRVVVGRAKVISLVTDMRFTDHAQQHSSTPALH